MDIVYPLDINVHGEVVGHAYTASGAYHAFYWSLSTGMIDLGTLGGASSAAEHINDDGTITGYAQRTDGKYAAFVWEAWAARSRARAASTRSGGLPERA